MPSPLIAYSFVDAPKILLVTYKIPVILARAMLYSTQIVVHMLNHRIVDICAHALQIIGKRTEPTNFVSQHRNGYSCKQIKLCPRQCH